MLHITPPHYIFCPFCGRELTTFEEEGRIRKRCEYDKWTYYPIVAASAAAVIVRNDTVLLVKRGREPYKGMWMFPAGFVDYGEHPRETVAREVKEETGLEILDAAFIDVLQVTDDPRQPGHFGFFYKVQVGEGELINDKEENQDIQWFKINDLPIVGWEGHKKMATLLQEGKI